MCLVSIWEFSRFLRFLRRPDENIDQRSPATSISANGHLANLLLWQYGFRSYSSSFRLISVSIFSPNTFCGINWPCLCSWNDPDSAEQVRSSLRYQRAERRQVGDFLRRRRYRISKSFSTECFTDYVGGDRAWKCIQFATQKGQWSCSHREPIRDEIYPDKSTFY